MSNEKCDEANKNVRLFYLTVGVSGIQNIRFGIIYELGVVVCVYLEQRIKL